VLKKAISAAFFFALFSFSNGLVQAEVPEWLRALARQPAKTYADDVNAVVLLDDNVTTVKENGDIVRHGRRVVRILRPEGRNEGDYARSYNGDSKVNYLRGWSITSKGQEYETKSSDIFESSVSSYEVYSDAKVKALRVPGTDVGTVVGFEYEELNHPYTFHDTWMFQETEPVERSHYELHLASGWRFQSQWMNHQEEKPTEENGAVKWQLTDIPRIENEPRRPPHMGLAGGAVFTFFNDKIPGKSFRNWGDIGTWYTGLSSDVRSASPALSQKVQELAPASMPLIQRIKALAGFAQHDVRYVAIEIGVGGYKPHSASDIFTHRYGDCKDKATVLSAMLAQVGVKSYYIIVNATRGVVTKQSPATPGAFNHMILAIALPEASYSMPMPALYEHPKLGHLLIFDPTNDVVPFGQIPYYEQDNYGLLVGEQGGELIHMPLSPPEANGVFRSAKLKLVPDGTLQGEIEERYTGFNAMLGREFLQHESENDRKKIIERLVANSLGNFQLDKYELVNANDIDQDLIIKFNFSAAHYAKNAGSMLLVRPRVLGELAGPWDANKPRHYAYEFRGPFLDRDTVEISLPEGFKVDELPDPAKITFPFAEYVSKTESGDGVLKYTREYKQTASEVSLEHMDELKKFFSQINLDEKNMAVLKKAN